MGRDETIEGGIGPGKDHVEKGIKGREPDSDIGTKCPVIYPMLPATTCT